MKKKKRADRLPPFAAILNDEMLSTAYRELSGSAAKAYPHFKRFDGICKKKNGVKYSVPFDFTYTEAEKLGFARRTFSRVIGELHGKGFIDIIEHGGMRGCGLSNTKYKLSSRWIDYGKRGFLNYSRYPSEP